ncbi:4-hydroxythreonine-4-phosphate dehydrogenase PdxA [Fusibacter paucivorans]|uniref:4-hydroxythreonine-4-phosphate dehydrogenase PdxA n=1 Tax=Fusibacter paucivorans TaxID=76009 RepID=A0ABS5PMF2_9FIRM|nr:4-hydroxythreonine-4-phosphate dehydrogenase PdxA [Fusibacter paucivorans]MBS7526360.1 4-hydroxythreonine-4-phosphate dehydrogenase PdxA [Fusibacter paucivorans]
MVNEKPIIAVPMGDAAGIGPEIVAKLAANGFLERYAKPIILGDQRVLELGKRIAKVDFDYHVATDMREAVAHDGLTLVDTQSLDTADLKIGVISGVNGKEQGDRLVDCIGYCNEGLIEGFCFAPLNKAAMKKGGYDFPSEHELFAHYYGIKEHYGEMNVMEGLWNIRVTSHIPLCEVSKNINEERIMDAVTLGYNTLKRVGIDQPVVAVAALNPHGGDNGTCGREEIDIIQPAMALAKEKGMPLIGPFPSDTLFIRAFNEKFDGVVTMYHDQGQIAIKLKGFAHCVTVSAGLPHAITTPAHGTAYDIAGKGICKTSTFEDAYKIAAKMAITDRSIKVR